MAHLVCQTCGTAVPLDEPIPRDSSCEQCGTDLRCCRNCRHWDRRYNNECTETEAEPVADKTRRNFCEFFYFRRATFAAGQGTGSGTSSDRAAEARARLEALFKRKEPEG